MFSFLNHSRQCRLSVTVAASFLVSSCGNLGEAGASSTLSQSLLGSNGQVVQTASADSSASSNSIKDAPTSPSSLHALLNQSPQTSLESPSVAARIATVSMPEPTLLADVGPTVTASLVATPKAFVAQAGSVASDAYAHCASGVFPTQPPMWNIFSTLAKPVAATEADGFKPEIRQVRNGKVVATYRSFGGTGSTGREYDPANIDATVGAFSRKPFGYFEEGDVYEVYPAVYKGEDQQPWIGRQSRSHADYANAKWVVPKNITIRGITVNGKRPVIKLSGIAASNNTLGQSAIYVGESEGITIENIEIDGNGTTGVGKAGIYVNQAKNLTLKNLKVHGFKAIVANGIFGSTENLGSFTMEGLEVSNNGGDNGPEHNFYLNASTVDANFKVVLKNSWSYDAFYGHLFKSRAQNNTLEGNYFMGTASTGKQTETYPVDIPNGGNLVMRNNVLVKTRSGDNSNGAFVTFGVETEFHASSSVLIEHNTFVALTKYYDSAYHQLYPFFLGRLNSVNSAPIYSASVTNNLFSGFCPQQAGVSPYYGTDFQVLAPGVIGLGFAPSIKTFSQSEAIIGSAAYRHVSGGTLRTSNAIGAID